ncbi:hypothetical protein B1810_19450 [Panacagrimonas perspica]|nr:hypothetical protein B1810_19450 [Panacagrimonas perspica]
MQAPWAVIVPVVLRVAVGAARAAPDLIRDQARCDKYAVWRRGGRDLRIGSEQTGALVQRQPPVRRKA